MVRKTKDAKPIAVWGNEMWQAVSHGRLDVLGSDGSDGSDDNTEQTMLSDKEINTGNPTPRM